MSAHRRPGLLLQLGCMFLLLFAQQAALTHAVWHARASAPAQELRHGGVVAKQASRAPETAVALCAFDAAFGQMLGAAPCADHDTASTRAAVVASRPHAQASAPQPFLAPLSRGPPASLLS